MWYIGNIKIKNRVCLAPMAGVSNNAFRKIIKEMGAGLIFCEMVSDKAIAFDNQKTLEMLFMEEIERPIVQQIFGSNKESFVEAARKIEKIMNPDIIDINMGCPVHKVAIKNQAGAALLKNPDQVYEIVKAVVESVSCPVTVKIRSGWDSNSINAKEIALICELAGAAAITVHARTRSQGYSGNANLQIIKDVKKAVKIPVIGNGDIKSPEDALRMLEITNCDAIMVGRQAIKNPLIIKDIVDTLDKKEIQPHSNAEIINLANKHFEYLLKIKKENIAVLEFRMFLSNYIKGFDNAKEIRQKIMTIKEAKAMKTLLKSLI